MFGLEQICKVDSGELDGDEFGNEWKLFYILYQSRDSDSLECFELWEMDDNGNGTLVCRGYHLGRMRSLTLRLGELIEWKEGVPLQNPFAKAMAGVPFACDVQ